MIILLFPAYFITVASLCFPAASPTFYETFAEWANSCNSIRILHLGLHNSITLLNSFNDYRWQLWMHRAVMKDTWTRVRASFTSIHCVVTRLASKFKFVPSMSYGTRANEFTSAHIAILNICRMLRTVIFFWVDMAPRIHTLSVRLTEQPASFTFHLQVLCRHPILLP